MKRTIIGDGLNVEARGWETTIAELTEGQVPAAAGFWRVIARMFAAPGYRRGDIPDAKTADSGIYHTLDAEWTPEGKGQRARIREDFDYKAVAERADMLAVVLQGVAEGRYGKRLSDFAREHHRLAKRLGRESRYRLDTVVSMAFEAGMIALVPFLREHEPVTRHGREFDPRQTPEGKKANQERAESERQAIRDLAAANPPTSDEKLQESYYPRIAVLATGKLGKTVRWTRVQRVLNHRS